MTTEKREGSTIDRRMGTFQFRFSPIRIDQLHFIPRGKAIIVFAARNKSLFAFPNVIQQTFTMNNVSAILQSAPPAGVCGLLFVLFPLQTKKRGAKRLPFPVPTYQRRGKGRKLPLPEINLESCEPFFAASTYYTNPFSPSATCPVNQDWGWPIAQRLFAAICPADSGSVVHMNYFQVAHTCRRKTPALGMGPASKSLSLALHLSVPLAFYFNSSSLYPSLDHVDCLPSKAKKAALEENILQYQCGDFRGNFPPFSRWAAKKASAADGLTNGGLESREGARSRTGNVGPSGSNNVLLQSGNESRRESP